MPHLGRYFDIDEVRETQAKASNNVYNYPILKNMEFKGDTVDYAEVAKKLKGE